ncbi:MAG: Hsp20/alpha crystallin family protein [Verrucomicrobiota bacterium]|jgi:HSP20 family protein
MNAVAQQQEKPVCPQPADTEREFLTPKVNIVENQDGYVLEAELPGVNKEGLDISLDNNELTIVGRRQAEFGASLLYRESENADYRRVFELDPTIDTAKIAAKIEQGILTLTLPKTEQVKPRRIKVS